MYHKDSSWQEAKHTSSAYGKENNSITTTLEEVLSFPILAIEKRGISQRTAEHFGVRTELSEVDREPVAHYFPYTDEGEVVGFKKRDLTKHKKDKGHFSVVGRVKVDCDLFGTIAANKTGGKKVYITEGEYDALTTWQVLKNEGGMYVGKNPGVLSIGLGTSNAVKHISSKNNSVYLKKYSQVILAFDNDSSTPIEKAAGIKRGREATASVYDLMPEVLVVPLDDGFDPCDQVDLYGANSYYWNLMGAKPYTPEGFITFKDIREDALKPPVLGRGWPWPTVMRQTFGRRDGEGYYFGAAVKAGKSTLLDTLVDYILTNDTYLDSEGNEKQRKCAIFKFEEKPAQTLQKIAGKRCGKDFSNPGKRVYIKDGVEVDVWGDKIPVGLRDSFFTDVDIEKGIDDVGDSLILYNNYGRCEWSELKCAIRHAVLVEHVKDVFIDPITRLTAGMSASDANTELEHFSNEISKMAIDLNFTFYCFCHLLAPQQGKKHEFGGRINSAQFRGSRAMVQSCYYTIGLECNKDPDLPERVRNTRYFVILDDRAHGRTCRIPLFYDVDTGSFLEPPFGFLEQDDEDESTCQTLSEWFDKYPEGLKVDEF